jgi:hypothetical protein
MTQAKRKLAGTKDESARTYSYGQFEAMKKKRYAPIPKKSKKI